MILILVMKWMIKKIAKGDDGVGHRKKAVSLIRTWAASARLPVLEEQEASSFKIGASMRDTTK